MTHTMNWKTLRLAVKAPSGWLPVDAKEQIATELGLSLGTVRGAFMRDKIESQRGQGHGRR